jgi:hypothetical protein
MKSSQSPIKRSGQSVHCHPPTTCHAITLALEHGRQKVETKVGVR